MEAKKLALQLRKSNFSFVQDVGKKYCYLIDSFR
jgi:hypothetical protein